MNRLQAEFHRLYGPNLIDAAGHARAMVLELAHPADWDVLSSVWRGVQNDLGLPAPAIAVSGTDGLQLWFSLYEPIDPTQAQTFLESLRRRYLPAVARERVRLLPALDLPGEAGIARHAERVPALQPNGNWSAFVAPDLAPLFSQTPWLDIPPGEEGQAKLLSGLESITPPMFSAVLAQLTTEAAAALAGEADARPLPLLPAGTTEALTPRDFLLAVMNDEGVSLTLRIEAAKALLPYTPTGGPGSHER